MGDRVDELGMVHSCEPSPAYRVPQHPGIGGSAPNPYEEAEARRAHNEGYRAGIEAVKKAILDIDAHATGLAEDEDGFVTGGYIISVGSLHRALGIVGHAAPKCPLCSPSTLHCRGLFASGHSGANPDPAQRDLGADSTPSQPKGEQ